MHLPSLLSESARITLSTGGEDHWFSEFLVPSHHPRAVWLNSTSMNREPRYRVAQNIDLDRQILSDLQTTLIDYHQYVPLYKHAFEVIQHNNMNDVEFRLRLTLA